MGAEIVIAWYIVCCILYTGVAGLVWLGIRSERQRNESLLKQSIRLNMMRRR